MIRIALVHDWLTGMRGGEYVLEAIAEIFPRAHLFTLLYVPGSVAPNLTVLKRHTSWLQKVPNAEHRYRYFLPFMPSMIERFDLDQIEGGEGGFDLVISSSHCVAKGIRKPKNAVHVSYVYTPMRYIWDRYDDYFGPGKSSWPVRMMACAIRKKLQDWDRKVSSPERVDHIIGISHFIADRIQSAYGRQPEVIYPFADLTRFVSPRKPSRNYLMVGAFAPYKRVDLAIEAFNRLKLPLLIVGSGQNERQLKKLAGPTIQFLGPLSNAAIADLYSKCRALVFPGIEDFGITPLEAMASGAPVVAFSQGGVSETVTEKTGIFFHEQTVESLIEAIQKMEEQHSHFLETNTRARAAEFSKQRFQSEFRAAVEKTWVKSGKSIDLLSQEFNFTSELNDRSHR